MACEHRGHREFLSLHEHKMRIDYGYNFFSIDSYLQATIEERKSAFYHYLISNGYAVSTSVKYPKFCSTNETVNQLVNDIASKDSLFDVVDEYVISKIFVKTGPKKAAVGRYREFVHEILRRTNKCFSSPCESTKILYSCIEILNVKSFTKKDLLRFAPLYTTLYTGSHNIESVITEAIETLINEEKIQLTSVDCYRLK